jgi:hypothetical protein
VPCALVLAREGCARTHRLHSCDAPVNCFDYRPYGCGCLPFLHPLKHGVALGAVQHRCVCCVHFLLSMLLCRLGLHGSADTSCCCRWCGCLRCAPLCIGPLCQPGPACATYAPYNQGNASFTKVSAFDLVCSSSRGCICSSEMHGGSMPANHPRPLGSNVLLLLHILDATVADVLCGI